MKLILKGLVVIFISYLILLTEKEFFKNDLFKVKRVKVNHTSLYLSRDVEKIQEYLFDKNILEIDIDFLERLFDNDIRIKKSTVKITAPGELEILLKEREPKYYAQIGNKVFLMDEEGTIFAHQDEKEKMDLPIFSAKNSEEIKQMLEIISNIQRESFQEMISQIYVKDKHCVVLMLVDGTMIYTNDKVQKKKYNVVETLYNNLVSTRKLEYVDLRFQDYIVKYLGEMNEK